MNKSNCFNIIDQPPKKNYLDFFCRVISLDFAKEGLVSDNQINFKTDTMSLICSIRKDSEIIYSKRASARVTSGNLLLKTKQEVVIKLITDTIKNIVMNIAHDVENESIFPSNVK